MSNVKRILIILLHIFGTPLLGLAIGYFIGGTREDPSNLAATFGLGVGIFASVISLVLGIIISFIMRNTRNPYYSLAGYFIPCTLAILYLTFFELVSLTKTVAVTRKMTLISTIMF